MRKKKARRSSAPGPRLYSYQKRWVNDESRFKIACKARQIGFTFAAAFRVVSKRLLEPGLTLWISASERQALEAMEHIRRFGRELKVAALYEEEFIEGTQVKQRQVRLPNGSRIIALPANPDTVRGFAGDVVLDEFAFHRDAEAIWRAAFATATRGFQIEIISTPNGTRGKYYELAKAAGLVDWQAGMSAPLNASILSPHWVDLAEARGQGFRVDVEALRAAIGDQDAWEQEYCCRFLSDVAHYIPPELVVAAESSAATSGFELSGETRTGFPQASSQDGLRPASFSAGLKPRPSHAYQGPRLTGHVFLGVDIGRKRDLTVLWLLEAGNPEAPPEARAYVTRGVLTLDRKPFAQQRAAIEALLAERQESQISDCRFQIHRCAMDASGLGAMLAEELAARWGERVEPVVFTSTVKEMLAVRVKRLLEERRLKIPYDPAIRAALGSVKRLVTAAGNVRFDAERTDASGHADHFWALALALHAAEEPGLSVEYVSNAQPRASTLAHSF